MADLSQQLRMQQELNNVLQNRQKLLESNTEAFSKQAQFAKTLNNSMQGNNLDAMREKVSGVKQGLDQTVQSTRDATEATKDLGTAAQKAGDDFEAFKKKAIGVGAAIGALKGLRTGISMVVGVMKAGFRIVSSFVKGIFNIGKAIISIPFKMWGALMDMGGGGGSPVFLQALEKIRETFGDIKVGSGKALADSAREMRREFTKLSGATDVFRGPTFGKVFGYGREGLAKALEFNAEMATALGGSFASMRDGMKGNFSALAIYRKGLGLSADAMANFMKLNEYAGKSYMDGFKELTVLADEVGGAFGFSSKEVGRTLGTMLEDVKNFGGFTRKEMVQMSVQTMRLGLELKAVTGVVDAFDSFDDAAKKVGNLHRMFGMQLDAMKMFRQEDPVKRIQMLQKSFKAAGNDVQKLNRRQVSFLAQQAGIDEKSARIMFSKKGLEMDYDNVKKKTEKAQKKQLKTADVLAKLSRQIERIFGGGGGKYKGFFDAFAKGFGRGVKRTREFRKMMININRSLRTTALFGRRVGRSFVKNFPGVKQFLGAMADFFNPRKLAPALRLISKEFDRFFKALRPGNEKKAFETMGKNVMKILNRFFGKKGEALDLLKKSALMIGEIMLNIKLIAAEKAVKHAAEGIKIFTSGLSSFLHSRKGKDGIGGQLSQNVMDGFEEKFGKNANNLAQTIMKDLVPALKKAGPVLMDAIFWLFGEMRKYAEKHIDKISDAIVATLKLVFKVKMNVIKRAFADNPAMGIVIAGMIMGPTAVMAIGGALKAALGLALGKFVGAKFGGSVLAKVMFGGTGVASRAFQASAGKAGALSAKSFSKQFTKKAGEGLGRGATKALQAKNVASFGRGAAKHGHLLKSAEAAKSAKNFGQAAKLTAQYSDEMTNFMSRAARTNRTNIVKGSAKVASEVAEQGVKTGFKAGAKKLAKAGGAKVMGAAIGSIIPGAGTIAGFAIGAIIDAGFAFANYEKTAEETGQTGAAAFTGEFVSGMTLGFVDAADVIDDMHKWSFGLIGDGLAKVNQVVAREAPHLARHYEAAMNDLKPLHDNIQKKFDDLQRYRRELSEGGKDFLNKNRGKMSADHLNFSESHINKQEASLKRMQDAKKKFNVLKDEQGRALGAWNRMMEKAEDESDDNISDDIYVSMAGVSPSHQAYFQEQLLAYSEDIGRGFVKMKKAADGTMTMHLDDDLYDNAERFEKFKSVTQKVHSFMKAELAQVEKLTKAETRLYKDRSKYKNEDLQARYKEGLKLGDHGVTASMKHELGERAKEMVQKNYAATLRKHMDALGVNPAAGSWGGLDPTSQADNADIFESIANVDPGLADKLKTDMRNKVEQQRNKLLGVKDAAAAEAAAAMTPNEKRLNKLEKARETVAQLKSLANVPAELAKLKTKLAKVKTEDVAAHAAKVITVSRQVAAAIEKELNKPENKGLTEAKTQTLIDTAVTDNTTTLTTMSAGIMKIMKDARALPKQTEIDRRKDLLVAAWGTTVTLISELNTKAAGKTLGLSTEVDDAMTTMAILTEGFGAVVPKNLNTKIAASAKAIRAAKDNIGEIAKLTGETRAEAIVNLVQAINSGGKLTVESKANNNPIQVKIHLNVSPKALAQSMVKVKGVKGGHKDSQIMVTSHVDGVGKSAMSLEGAIKSGGSGMSTPG